MYSGVTRYASSGRVYGGGGGGLFNNNSAAGRSGSNGAQGIVIIHEYS